MGMAHAKIDRKKIMNVYLVMYSSHGSRKANIARGQLYNNTKILTVVREAISKNSVLKDIMPGESNGGTLSGISVKVPIQFRSNAGHSVG